MLDGLFALDWFSWATTLLVAVGFLALAAATVGAGLRASAERSHVDRRVGTTTDRSRALDDCFRDKQFAGWSPLHRLRAHYAHGDLDDETYERLEGDLQRMAARAR